MRRHPPAWLAWPLAAVPLIVAAASIAAALAWPGLAAATYAESAAEYVVGAFWLLGAPIVGAVVASRRPDLLYGWLLLALGITDAALTSTGLYGTLALIARPDPLPLGLPAAWAAHLLWLAVIVHLPFLLLLFPDGRLPSPRWRWLVRAVAGLGLLALAFGVFLPGQMGVVPVENPLGATGAAATLVEVGANAAVSGLFVAVIAGGVSLFVRRRRAGPQQRLQLKWFAYAAVICAVLLTVNGAVAFLAGPLVNALLGALTFNALFAAIGVAVLRYRLYEIDRLVSRTVSYALLSALLVGVYLVAVLALPRLLAPLRAGSELAVAGATLAAAALFAPARWRIQQTVDRRFNRARYDAQRALDAFRARLRGAVDLGQVADELQAATRATVAPSVLSLWLPGQTGMTSRPEHRARGAARAPSSAPAAAARTRS